jgi:TonB family protein
MKALLRYYFLSLAFLLVVPLPTSAAQNECARAPSEQPAPTVLRSFAPEPVEFFGFIQKGVLVFEFTVTAAGDVYNLKLVSSTNSALDDGAMRTIKQWKFNPAIKHGKRVSCRVTQTLNVD